MNKLTTYFTIGAVLATFIILKHHIMIKILKKQYDAEEQSNFDAGAVLFGGERNFWIAVIVIWTTLWPLSLIHAITKRNQA